MHLIIGGRCQGKLQFAKGIYGDTLTVCDLVTCDIEAALKADIIVSVHEGVKKMLLAGGNPSAFFKSNIDKMKDKILIGDEIGSGVVPIEALEREWRDEIGRLYQLIASKAERVDRVWAGIGQRMK